jgi:hypothetical protein
MSLFVGLRCLLQVGWMGDFCLFLSMLDCQIRRVRWVDSWEDELLSVFMSAYGGHWHWAVNWKHLDYDK